MRQIQYSVHTSKSSKSQVCTKLDLFYDDYPVSHIKVVVFHMWLCVELNVGIRGDS